MGIFGNLSVPSFVEMFIGPTGPVGLPQAVGPDVQTPNRDALTSGSQLDRTAIGPWPELLDAAVANDTFTGFTPNTFHDQFTVQVGANYGNRTSIADWGYRGYEFGVGNPNDLGQGSIGSYPGPVRSASRPTYDNLEAIIWNQQILDVVNTSPQTWGIIQQGASEYVPGGTATLGIQSPTLV